MHLEILFHWRWHASIQKLSNLPDTPLAENCIDHDPYVPVVLLPVL